MPLTENIILKYGEPESKNIFALRLLVDTEDGDIWEVPKIAYASSFRLMVAKLNKKINSKYTPFQLESNSRERPLAMMYFIDATLLINIQTKLIIGEFIGVSGSIQNALKIKYSKMVVDRASMLLDGYINSGKTYIKAKDIQFLKAA